MNAIIRTISGLDVDLTEPWSATIRLWDICHALARLNRFTGHTEHPISVAEHSMAVAFGLASAGYDDRTVLLGLCHDFPEAYLGDVARPLKQLPQMVGYRDLEHLWSVRIHYALDLPPWTPERAEAVREYDEWSFGVENEFRFNPDSRSVKTPDETAQILERLFHDLHAQALKEDGF